MKRTAPTLVSYSSSDESDVPTAEVAQPVLKKRSLSQRRILFGFVYLILLQEAASSVLINCPSRTGRQSSFTPRSCKIHTACRRAMGRTCVRLFASETPCFGDIWPDSDVATRCELHVSLSRPIFLRAHQREDLRNAVKSIAKKHKPFIASFATLSELINDEKTRTFLTLEVGAGYHELRALADALKPSLQTIRQQEYYDNPRFHASIAWARLHNEKQVSGVVNSDGICASASPADASASLTSSSENIVFEEFPSIASLPVESIELLNKRYGPELRSPKVGSFDVETISLKIGKEVYSWRLDAL